MADLVRVSKADNLLVSKKTLYNWRHTNKFPGLFVKFGGMLFVDQEVLSEILESGRIT